MVRPVSCIQLLPKAQVPYQRKPMTMFATAAMMMASQFTFPSNAKPLPWGRTLAQWDQHSHLFCVSVVLHAELLPQERLFCASAQPEGREREEERSGDEQHAA